MPQGASIPALGLSNKAVYDDELNNNNKKPDSEKVSLADELYKEVYFNVVDLNSNYSCRLKKST